MSNAIYPPEYASKSVVVIVPMAALPPFMPDRAASFQPISGFFSITSLTADVMSTDKSIIAPDAPIKIPLI